MGIFKFIVTESKQILTNIAGDVIVIVIAKQLQILRRIFDVVKVKSNDVTAWRSAFIWATDGRQGHS